MLNGVVARQKPMLNGRLEMIISASPDETVVSHPASFLYSVQSIQAGEAPADSKLKNGLSR